MSMGIMEIFGYIFLFIGAFFILMSSIGILRMPDFYTRIQTGTKASTLGAMTFILGIGFMQPEWLVKIIVIIIFIAISNPISSHAIARASHKTGLRPCTDKEDGYDAYEIEKMGGDESASNKNTDACK